MHSPIAGIQSKITAAALALMLVTLWLALHGYHGFTGDGQIYAFQAFARIHPQLSADLYLQNTSQDQFTIFSPFYAWFIAVLGLENAGRLLTVLFTVWLLAAAWSFTRAVAGRDAAWLGAAFLLIVAGDYGGSGVFCLSEQYLTARFPAEALVVTALACHVRGRKRLALSLAVAALFVHPLIALPGLLLLICLWLPGRVAVLGAIAGVSTALGIAVIATLVPAAGHVLPIMDAAWLEVVQERSQFLFLQLWSVHDWSVNAQPFIYLGVTAIAVPDERIARLCRAAALVGSAGLAVAFIAGAIGPVAVLVQGQAWRWVWITVLTAALLLPMTVLHLWRDEKCGPLCAILLVTGWTLSAVDGTACVSLALFFWVTRTHVNTRIAALLRWMAAALGAAILGWALFKSWEILSPASGPTEHVLSSVTQIQDILDLRIPAVLFAVLAWWTLRNGRPIWIPTALCALLLTLSAIILPGAFKQTRTLISASAIHEFADWISAIPPTRTVLVTPTHDVGAFVWFTLGRPNYLALDQSAGVVFSRATALEVRRRSEVLLPLMEPNWKILTNQRAKSAHKPKVPAAPRPLTASTLIHVCTDPQLGFVISPQDVGFHPLRHRHDGVWKNWNLYDCRIVRSAQLVL